MSEIPENPFLTGSVEVPAEEVAAAARELAEEAARVREKESEIKEKAALARAQKEALRKAELARIEAEIAATREQVVKAVANIPKASDKPTIRPEPPSPETYAPGSTLANYSGNKIFYFLDEDVSLPALVIDAIAAGVAVTFTFLIFMEM